MSKADRPSLGAHLLRMPLFLLVFGMAAGAMMIPAMHAVVADDFSTARAFFYSGLIGLMLFAMISIAMAGRTPRYGALGQLLSLLSVMVVLPAGLALPFYEALETTTFFNAYIEMVSAATTTGATLFEDPARLTGTLHLWRAQVGWMGGFVMWAAAAAILAPLNLGGFEITARAEPGRTNVLSNRLGQATDAQRLVRTVSALFPIYAGLTLALWVLLLISGDDALVALCHAMSIMSTSGISPLGGLEGSSSGITGEAVMFLFMVFAISRLTFSTDTVTTWGQGIHTDPEFRLAVVIVLLVPILLFVRHWLGAFDVGTDDNLSTALRALWGSLFTVMSFLTTTGFTSSTWEVAQNWTGLSTPGLILMGLALVGGGVATTAGGVKLLRVFALYRHGVREMERLVHPSSVSGVRGFGRRLQRQGAYIAWVFFMLFALSFAAISLLFSAQGAPFEEAMVLAIASLSNTGPLLQAASVDAISLAGQPVGTKIVFCIGMVVGRLETLAIIALLTPDLWRG